MTGRADRLRAAGRELWSVIALWLGLGDDDATGRPVRRGAAFLAVQCVVAVALAAAVPLGRALLFPGGTGRGWLFGLLLPVLPLLAGIARTPPGYATALTAAGPAGLAVGALAWFALHPVVTGYWLFFAVIAAGSLAAGPVFGALARDEPAPVTGPARPEPDPFHQNRPDHGSPERGC